MGQLALREGRGDDALTELRRAQVMFDERDDRWGRYHTLSSIEAIHFWKGDFRGAARFCRRALKATVTSQQKVHTLISLGSANVYMARWNAAERLWDEAEGIADASCAGELARVAALRAHAAALRGNAVGAYEELAPVLERATKSRYRILEAEVLSTLLDIAICLGFYPQAEQFAAAHRQHCARYGLDHLTHMPDDSMAQIHEAMGDVELSTACLSEICQRSMVQEDQWSLVWSLVHLCEVHRRAGNAEESLRYSGQAGDVARGASPLLVVLANANHCYCLEATGAVGGGSLDAVRRQAEEIEFRIVALQCQFWSAVVEWRRGDVDQGLAILRRCVPQQLRLGHIHFLTQELASDPEIGFALLDDRAFAGQRPALIRALSSGPRSAQLLEDAIERGEDLACDTLAHGLENLPKHQVARIVAKAKRHKSAAVRRAAWALRPQDRGGGVGATNVLSRREMQVIQLMANGERNAEIAEKLYLSETTVKTHVNHIFTKLAVVDRVQAVLWYRESFGPDNGQNTPLG